MSGDSEQAALAALEPIRVDERIQALDVIRGFALIGIFLMNVEWFTRPFSDLGTGVDVHQTGISYFASWFIYTFVQGKFWTMFSLLFGMGFAVMLTRAESGKREFVAPYVRRIIGLAIFGSAHYVLIWGGDILHNYAIAAVGLLLIVTGSWRAWGASLLIAAAGYALGPGIEAGISTGIALLLVAVLMYFLGRGSLARYWKFGVTLYLLPYTLAFLYAAASALFPSVAPSSGPEAVKERTEIMAKKAKDRAEEVQVLSQGSYAESVRFRAREYADEMQDVVAGSMMSALPLFLVGFWFIRSGVVTRLHEHIPLFRRLLRWTMPLGLGITLASVALHASFQFRVQRDPTVGMARMLFEIGALPLTIGYVSALVCLLQTQWGRRILMPLRHAGRMALTNYLGASLIGTWYFCGYGLGHFGQMSRAGQVLFVAVVFGLQLLASFVWLSRYRYGPMEWLWRAITYWQFPVMRRESVLPAPKPLNA